jgi:hypothetical protein
MDRSLWNRVWQFRGRSNANGRTTLIMNKPPTYKPASNVSDPLQNTRPDGQWDYRPLKKPDITVPVVKMPRNPKAR